MNVQKHIKYRNVQKIKFAGYVKQLNVNLIFREKKKKQKMEKKMEKFYTNCLVWEIKRQNEKEEKKKCFYFY